MPTGRNPFGLRDYGVLGTRTTRLTNAVLRRTTGPVRPAIVKAPLQPRRLPNVRESLPGSQTHWQRVRAGKRNGPKVG